MRSLRLLSSLLLALVLVAAALHAATPPSSPRFAHEHSDLRPDPAARYGTLPNGLRYVILPNHEPKNRASLRLLVMAGSFHEADDQRGLAHFLEHMAFNGSRHYQPGTLIEYFQRLGMNFGGDTNAYTSYDHTAYMLELPDTRPHTLEEGLRVFADYAGGLLLLDTEIDKERGIILAEKRARDSIEYRQLLAELDFLLGTTLLPRRMPIGEIPVIEKAPRERFLDYYDTWYRPERMALVAVGDFDPAALEQQLAAALAPLQPRAPARPGPELGAPAPCDGLRAAHHHEPEAPATTVSIQVLRPYAYEPDTTAKRLALLPRDLAVAMLNRRLAILAKKEDAPFTTAHVVVGDSLDFFLNAAVELTCKPEQWPAALALAEQELRRAAEHGFQPAELAEAAANHLNALDQAVKTASTRRSEDLAGEILETLAQGAVFTTPADDRALLAPALAALTPARCTDALRAAFAAPGRHLTVMGNAKIEGDAPAAITAAYLRSAATPVAPPEQLATASFAYADFGPPGAVTARTHIDDLDLTLVTFANGVRLNLKKTDFEANKIHLSVRVGTGQLTEPKDQPGLAFFCSHTFTAGGLGRHSADDLQRILAGKTVGVGFRVAPDALTLNGATNRDDLVLQLRLLAATLTDPGYRPEALRTLRKNLEQLYLTLDRTPTGPLQRDLPRLLANGDPRFGLPAQADALARNLDEARAWLTPQLAHGPVEIAIVGDIDLDATLAAVAQTLGALPARRPKPPLDAERTVTFPAEPFARTFTVASEIPKGAVALYWPTADSRDIALTRRLRLLTDVFNDRLRIKIREELGQSYSPQAASIPSDTYRDYGYLFTLITVDPAQAAATAEAALALAADLATGNITDDELARAKQPVLTALRDSARTNSYWLGAVLFNAQELPARLDWCRTRYSGFEAITAAELNAIAKKYLPPARAFRATVIPEKKQPSPR